MRTGDLLGPAPTTTEFRTKTSRRSTSRAKTCTERYLATSRDRHYALARQTALPIPQCRCMHHATDHSCYVQQFNRRHKEDGARLARRFDDVLVDSEAHALELFRYISMNPVRAGICSDPGDWRWSSYAAHVGLAAKPSFLTLEWVRPYFGERHSRSARLASFVPGHVRPPGTCEGALTPSHDRNMASGYTGPERRSGKDRRTGQERRKKERRSGPGDDRRSGRDRRSGEERRDDEKK